MKRYVFVGILLLVGLYLYQSLSISKTPLPRTIVNENDKNRVSPKNTFSQAETSLFVPYWNIPNTLSSLLDLPLKKGSLTAILYFGVTANENGSLDKNEQGFRNLDRFDKLFIEDDTAYKKVLTVRLTNQKIIDHLLSDSSATQNFAEECTQLAREKKYTGILLDLEYSALATKKTEQLITDTIHIFARNAKKQNLSIATTIFGDVLYRSRPYNLKRIGEIVDTVVIMAYDFTKRNQLPGPLFPLESAGYDFSKLLRDITKQIPAQKITIAYGMYGYVWQTDSKKRPLKPATAMTYAQIVSFMKNCIPPLCTTTISPLSNELVITNKNSDETYTIIHGESPTSIQKKIDTATLYGINKNALWAFGYY